MWIRETQLRNFEVFSSNNSSLNPYATHQSIGPLPSCFAVWWSEQTILADGVFEAMEMDERTFIPPLTASMPEMLPGGHRFEFPASMFFFVSSTADKKENKVNIRSPTRGNTQQTRNGHLAFYQLYCIVAIREKYDCSLHRRPPPYVDRALEQRAPPDAWEGFFGETNIQNRASGERREMSDECGAGPRCGCVDQRCVWTVWKAICNNTGAVMSLASARNI